MVAQDLDFLEMYPEGIVLQQELYDNLMDALQRDCRVLESFRIMDYSLLIGIHNLDVASREEAEAAGSDEDRTDNGGGGAAVAPPIATGSSPRPPLMAQASVLTDITGGLERQGSGKYKHATIAHATALESITALTVGGGAVTCAEGGGGGSSVHEEETVAGRSTASSRCGSVLDEDVCFPSAGGYDEPDEASVVKNVWGGIPARNHRGERVLLFIGIIDILQSYGALKKAEHYWKSLVTRGEGDTVSVHRPAFYAKRFQAFMKEKVFHPPPQMSTATAAGGPLRSGASIRRSGYRRATSKGEESGALPSSPGLPVEDGPPVRGVEDPPVANAATPSAVTVIRIGETSADLDEVNLPAVLQDRRKRQSSTASPTGATTNATTSPPPSSTTAAASLGSDRRPSGAPGHSSRAGSQLAPSSSSPEPSSTGN